MRSLFKVYLGSVLAFAGLTGQFSSFSFSASGYTQIVLPFKTEKEFFYDWNKLENTLILQFPSTSPSELTAFNSYDERLVRRMIVKDLGPGGSEIHLVLKDRSVRALVASFKDPFRVTVDLFDKDFAQAKDPVTGLPMAESDELQVSTSKENKLLAAEAIKESPEKQVKELESQSSKPPQQTKRRLLQALPDELNTPNELKAALANVAPGIGKSWIEFPPYVYRAQLAPYEGREAPETVTSPLQSQAIKSSSGMAAYASKLYDFGHEGRALLAYQQVLLKEPEAFERDPLHLWKFAECHLGQGNLQLAEGYYASLIDKHSTHALAKFAALRKVDITAVKEIQKSNLKALPGLVKQLESVTAKASPELNAQALIRKAWWTDPAASHQKTGALPIATEDVQRSLTKLIPNVESQRTAFLASSLIANKLTQKDTAWERSYAPWLNTYFNNFRGPSAEPYRTQLSQAAKDRITQEFKSQFAGNAYMPVVAMYESLPEPMKSIRKSSDVAWLIAESYRNIGHTENALPFYQTAAELPIGVAKFKAKFWQTSIAASLATDYHSKRGNQEKIRNLQNLSAKADGELWETWTKLKADEKAQIQTAMADALEADAAADVRNRTSPRILLEKYSSALTVNPPKLSTATGTNQTDLVGNFSPTASTVRLLDDLGKKFAVLGMQPERRKTLELMRFIKPSAFEQDKTAQKIWTDQLSNLAEEHRKANEFLEAGELYSMIGESGAVIENRAEANYKGGLLLYRAGKKQEAIKALERAKADPNNLFYSKLATERLDQLQAH